MTSAEGAAQSEYKDTSKDNKEDTAVKEQDVKYKTAEYVSIDKSISELKADKNGEGEELAAVLKYFESIKKQCIAKPDSYEERKERRDKEIAGLKDALETLQAEGEEALLQKSTSHRTLRGARQLIPSD